MNQTVGNRQVLQLVPSNWLWIIQEILHDHA